MFDFEIIDAHIHPFVDRADCFGPYGWPETPQEFVSDLQSCGIRRACGSAIIKSRAEDFDTVRDCNRDALKFRELYPDFFLPGISVHAAFPEESCRELEEMHRQGVRWIGELVSYMAGTSEYSVKSLHPVYDLAQSLGLPVNIHQHELDDIEKILLDFPGLKVVMAHPGEAPTYLARLALMKRYPNLYLDLSGTGLFRWGMLRHGVREVGAERFLFGSDYPVCNPAMYVHGVLCEKLSKRDYELIFAENFLRISGY